MKSKITLLLITILLWELVILFLATQISDLATLKYQLAARYSARTSFVIVVITLLFTGIHGLAAIYSSESARKIFMMMLLAFAFNHFIHFIYLAMNYYANDMQLLTVRTSFGTLGYILLTLAPFYLWNKTQLTRSLHIQIAVFLLITLSIFIVTYSGRFSKPVTLSSPIIFYQLCLGVIAMLLVLNVYQFIRHRRS
jgi:hypothetical protein